MSFFPEKEDHYAYSTYPDKSSLRADVSYFLSYFLRADVSFFMQAIESLKYDKIKHRKLVKEKLQNRVSIPT